MTDKKGNIQMGSHPIDEHECFSEGLDCLSHVLEKVMNIDSDDIPEAWMFEEIIYTAFCIGERLERKYFGGEYNSRPSLKIVSDYRASKEFPSTED